MEGRTQGGCQLVVDEDALPRFVYAEGRASRLWAP